MIQGQHVGLLDVACAHAVADVVELRTGTSAHGFAD